LPAGQPNGVASLDANGLVPASQLPGGLDAATLGGQPASYYAPASHSHAIGALSDVNTTGAADGQVLTLSGGTWVPTTLGMLIGIQVFTASGTWTKPAGCKRVLVSVRGGGGGGGAGVTPYYSTGPGPNMTGGLGGKGGATYGIIDVNAISSVPVTVGYGGPPSNTTGVGGSAGGSSSFGTFITAYGGAGGGAASASNNGVDGADGSSVGGIANGFEIGTGVTSYSGNVGQGGRGEYGTGGNNATYGGAGAVIVWEFG